MSSLAETQQPFVESIPIFVGSKSCANCRDPEHRPRKVARMLDYNEFSNSFPTAGPNPYDQNGVRAIETFRKGFDGVLFIDRVLRALGIGQGWWAPRLLFQCRALYLEYADNSVGKLYPPRGDNGVRGLHRQIMDSNVTLYHKLSVLYYLLLDFDYTFGTQSHLAQSLAEEASLPQKYQILMRGLWHMDHKEFKVSCLRSINPIFFCSLP